MRDMRAMTRRLGNGGTAIIPGSDSWIPDLLKDAEDLYLEIA